MTMIPRRKKLLRSREVTMSYTTSTRLALSESATKGSSQQISKSKRTAVPHQRVRTRTAMAVVVGNNDMAWNALRSATTTLIGTPLHGMTLLF